MNDLDSVLDSVQGATSSSNPDTVQFDPPDLSTAKKAPQKKPGKKMGPPFIFEDHPEMEQKVFDYIQQTPHSIKTICKKVGTSQQTWYAYLNRHPDKLEKYATYKAEQASLRVENLSAKAQELEASSKKDDPRRAAVRVQLFRIVSDNERWIAERMLPKRFGNSQTINANLAGAQGSPKIQIEFVNAPAEPKK
jgi:transposase